MKGSASNEDWLEATSHPYMLALSFKKVLEVQEDALVAQRRFTQSLYFATQIVTEGAL